LLHALERALHRLTGVVVPPDAWDVGRVPDHLRITFRVVDEDGRTLAEGKDLEALKLRLKQQMQVQLSQAVGDIEQAGLRTWSFGTLPQSLLQQHGSNAVQGYPALVDEGDSVAIRILATQAEQQHAMWLGTRRLLLLNAPSPVKAVHGRLTKETKLGLAHYPHARVGALFDDCIACATDKLIAECGGPVWDQDGFTGLHDLVCAELEATVFDVVTVVAQILAAARDVEKRVQASTSLALLPALTDIKAQLSGLVYPSFVTATGWRRLPDVLRYLRAIERRLDKLPNNPHRDRELMRNVEQVQNAYQRLLDELPPRQPVPEAVQQIRWMIEELRVSFFAQALGTAYPVSEKRVFRAMDELVSS